MNKEEQYNKTIGWAQYICQQSLATVHVLTELGRGVTLYHLTVHTPSLPCKNQRVGLGTPLVGLRPACSCKLWKINAYQ